MALINTSSIKKWHEAVRTVWSRTKSAYGKFIEAHLKDRTLRQTERFVFAWILVFILASILLFRQLSGLNSHHLVPGPAPGGQYTEGIVGSIGGINPLFTDGQASEAAAKLIFSGLFQVDGEGNVVRDLADEYSISEDQTTYTVKLRDDARWHDGRKLTAADVAFTVGLIQDPDVGSHLQLNWQDVDVEVVDGLSVVFKLPNPYAPFLHQLTIGVLPEHLLNDIEPERMRVTAFNSQPVGSGPFMFVEIAGGQQVRLKANSEYYGGAPQLDRFIIAAYEDEEAMIEAYNRSELAGMVLPGDFEEDSLADPSKSEVSQVNVGGQVFAFYNTRSLDDRNIRQALTQSINTRDVRRRLGDDYRTADSPLLPTQIGYQSSQLKYNPSAARSKFRGSGYRYRDGVLSKDGKQLRLRLATQDSYGYSAAADELKRQWEEAGVEIEIIAVNGIELQEEYLRPRNYDILLFGIGLDIDPDVFAYWHSSQSRDPGRNVSQYRSSVADVSLEDGRTRTDEELRAAKYETFQQQWRRDAPALALYRLHAYYVNRRELNGMDISGVAQPIDRFYNVTEWTINSQLVEKRLLP